MRTSTRAPRFQQYDEPMTTHAMPRQTSFFARSSVTNELFDSMIDTSYLDNDQMNYYSQPSGNGRSSAMGYAQSRSASVQFDNTRSFFSTSKASVKLQTVPQQVPAMAATTSGCDCLRRMLALLSLPDLAGQGNTIPDLGGLIVANKSILDAMSRVLTCSCSTDAYLLVILSLVAGKLIQSYSIAARTSISFNRDILNEPSSDLRTCIQQILHELHRMRSTIDLLSVRLGRCRAKQEGEAYLGYTMALEQAGATGGQMLSTAAIQQLDSDLKTQLRDASRNIVTMLQHL